MGKQNSVPEDFMELENLSGAEYCAAKGLLIYARSRYSKEQKRMESRIVLKDLKSGEERILTAGGTSEDSPRFSPDGEKAAFLSNAEGGRQIWVWDFQTGACERMTDSPYGVQEFLWSPQGDKFAFLSVQPEHPEEKREPDAPIVVEDFGYKADGAGFVNQMYIHLWVLDIVEKQARCLTDGPWNHLHPAWSPDGKEIAFVSGRAHAKKDSLGMDLFLVSVEDGQIRQISEGDWAVSYPVPFRPVFTRDGKYVLMAYLNKEFMAEAKEKGYPLTRLHRVSTDGKENVDIFPADDPGCFEVSSFPYFLGAGRSYEKAQLSGDGEHLLFVSGWMGQTNLYRINLFGTPKVELVAGGKQAFACLGPVQDGKMLVSVAKPDAYGDYWLMEEATGKLARRLTESNALLQERAMVSPEEIWIDTLDGEGRVHGFVLPPQNREPGKKYPAILYIHGGPHPYDTYGMEYEYQCLAGAGFAVIYCNPRGSSSYGREHQSLKRAYDGSAYTDCLQIVEEAVRKCEWIDGERIGVTGGSYGGYMTNYMATHCKRFKAYVTQRSISNELICYACSDMQGDSSAYPNFEEFMVHELERSAVSYAERVNAPILILHGTEDMRTPVEGAHQFFVALKDTHKELPVRMVLYPHTNHDIPSYMPQKLHYHREMIEWFRKYL
ncbi:MAG: S9 family peptidase [Eubacteriales bacterium]|nr:S9 family peptidase [Eubacteriales bacterium]